MDKEKKAIERIRMASEMSLHHYKKPLVCAYSGGKDSDVLLELFKRSGIPFEVHNSHTTADAPQTVRHIQKVFRGLESEWIKYEIEMPTYKGEPTSMEADSRKVDATNKVSEILLLCFERNRMCQSVYCNWSKMG